MDFSENAIFFSNKKTITPACLAPTIPPYIPTPLPTDLSTQHNKFPCCLEFALKPNSTSKASSCGENCPSLYKLYFCHIYSRCWISIDCIPTTSGGGRGWPTRAMVTPKLLKCIYIVKQKSLALLAIYHKMKKKNYLYCCSISSLTHYSTLPPLGFLLWEFEFSSVPPVLHSRSNLNSSLFPTI